jgi:hypothetical protein
MWRSIVLAAGISLGILGAEFMVVDRMVIADDATAADTATARDFASQTLSTFGSSTPGFRRRVLVPPEWAPWGFLSAGVLLVLYGGSLKGQDSE